MIAAKRAIIALIAGLVFAFVAPKAALAQGPV